MGLLWEVSIGDAGDIATIYVAIERDGADCPLMGLPFLADNDIKRNTVFDLLGNICGEAVVVAQLYFRPLCRGLIVCIVLCDLCRVVPWAAAGFCAKVWIQAMLYLPVYGGRSKAQQIGDFKARFTIVVKLLDTETV